MKKWPMIQEQLQIIMRAAIGAARAAGELPELALPELAIEQPQRP
jgi:hypothetical protein